MKKGRLEAFSDGVVAIIITIMVLELHIPHGEDISALLPLWPVFLSYILSFVYVGIYWNNHHHMLYIAETIDGKVLWSNLNLLFWLSLIPFVTDWMGDTHFSKWPVIVYGIILIMCGISFIILSKQLIRCGGRQSALARAYQKDWKGRISIAIYSLAIVCALFSCALALFLYFCVAVIWFVPDRRIEVVVGEPGKHDASQPDSE